jgi:1,4-alpha-glucan branching enzyme
MQGTKSRSPQVKSALKRVALIVRAPGARQVILTGDFTHWSLEGLALVQNPTGEWSANLALPPGEYQYRLIIDGKWCDDPQAIRQVPNAFGTQNGVLRVPYGN